MSLRIAHDIRSPVEALKAMASSPAAIDLELLNQVAERINTIANDLLDKNRARKGKEEGPLSSFILEHSIQSSIELKAVECKNDILFNSHGSDHLSVIGEKEGFERCLSNFFNNSIEAGAQKIDINTQQIAQSIQINIQDDGRGIPETIIAKLGNNNISIGKLKGNGIGVRSAAEEIYSWGGSISFANNKIGALVIITLKKSS